MDIAQVIIVMTIIVTNLGAVLFLHFRTEDRVASAIRDGQALHETGRRETHALIEAIRHDVQAIQQEMKDFHGRLCAIEERGRK